MSPYIDFGTILISQSLQNNLVFGPKYTSPIFMTNLLTEFWVLKSQNGTTSFIQIFCYLLPFIKNDSMEKIPSYKFLKVSLMRFIEINLVKNVINGVKIGNFL